MQNELTFKIVGVCPMIVHNGQLADPLNKWAKELKKITGKRKKTDDDYAEMARIEWYGGLYLNDDKVPVMPGVNIEAMLGKAAAQARLKKSFQSAVFCDNDAPILFTGPKDPEAMWKSGKFRDTRRVKLNGKSTVMRTRPIFHEWAIEFTVTFMPDIIDESQIREAVDVAGRLVGCGTYVPKFGRFSVEQSKG